MRVPEGGGVEREGRFGEKKERDLLVRRRKEEKGKKQWRKRNLDGRLGVCQRTSKTRFKDTVNIFF